ncbi:AMP-binding protein [Paenibacillus sp. sptzw28]|uniref:AMP-binding protein n=1 Tax=Paenibacillus sp. sptzw28 TaxID=715179 RepID=UPI001C6E9B5B|nr:AMP-binding protein [Paenibacillus sp. sptzw28]QYR19394.1 AMP-binding protein [Paenibacillus sp. sptzw28]
MLTVDDQIFDKNQLQALFEQMKRLDGYRNPEGKRYAVCLKHAFPLLAAVMYLRQRGGSVLLMHADTPLESAKAMAGNADCSYLLYGSWDTVLSIGIPSVHYQPALLQYSSGTTGNPALIERAWALVETEIENYNRLFQAIEGIKPVILVPVSHSFGLITGVLASIARGTEPIIIQDKNPRFALQALKNLNHHIVYTVPFILNVLDSLEKGKLHLNKAVISGSPPTQALLDRMNMQLIEIWQQYGCTEVGCISVGKGPSSPTDAGMALNHLHVSIQPDNSSAGEGKGEIIVTSDSKAVSTRDLGYLDPVTGRIHVLGRLDDLINVSGLKVIPSEVESVIGCMPGIRESVVVRTSHKVWGEAVRAIVVAASSVSEQDIRSWCIKHLPAYKVPSIIEFADAIPRMSSGKVSRKHLQEQER